MSKLEEFIEEKQFVALGKCIKVDDLRELGKDYVLLPKEPTKEILTALEDYTPADWASKETKKELFRKAYKAMIQASE